MVPNTPSTNGVAAARLAEYAEQIFALEDVSRFVWETTSNAKLALALSGAFESARRHTTYLCEAEKHVDSVRVLNARIVSIVEQNATKHLMEVAQLHHNMRDQRWADWFAFTSTPRCADDLARAYSIMRELISTPKSEFDLMSPDEKHQLEKHVSAEKALAEKQERRRIARNKRHAQQAADRAHENARAMELRHLAPAKGKSEEARGGTGKSKKSLHKQRKNLRRI